MAKLNVIPKLAVMDEEVDINFIGTDPNSALTVSASIVHFGILYLGYGHFYTDAHGSVNLKKHISYGGSYKGLQPMGLYSSARAMPSKNSCPGFVIKGSVEEHLPYEINAWKGHLTRDQVHQLHVKYPSLGTSSPVNRFYEKFFVAKCISERTYLSSTVKRIVIKITIDDEQIRGVLFLPNGNGPFPGVIDVHGGPGGCSEFRAALIANHGFATLALAYFNYEGLRAKTYAEIEMSYFYKAINWFSNQPKVIPGGISMVGFSLGAEAVVMSSIMTSKVISSVCINSAIWMDTDHTAIRKRWKRGEQDEGHEIRHGRIWKLINNKIENHRPKLHYRHDNPILFLIGELDLNSAVIDDTIDQLKKSGKKNVFRTVIEGQGHMIDPPYTPARVILPTVLRKWGNKSSMVSPNAESNSDDPYELVVANMQQEWGGNYENHGKSQLEAWQILLEFLKKNSFRSSSKL